MTKNNKDSEIIRTEIIRVLNENGKTSGTDLAKRVTAKVGNEKTVYREISFLVETGEIEKRVYDRTHIEYELIDLYESVNNQLKNLHKEVEIIFEEIANFGIMQTQKKLTFQDRLRTIVHAIHVIQATDGIMKLLAFYPAFKKDKMFSQINRKITDCWQVIMNIISQQSEEKFLNEVLSNLRLSNLDPKNVN